MAGQRKSIGRRWLTAYALLAVLLIACAFAHSAIARQLNDWKVLPQPERLTELYFTHPTALPTTYAAGQTQTVAFTAHNLEHRITTYTYSIAANDETGNASQTLAHGTFTLAEDQTKNVTANVTLPALGNREQITVSLTNVSTSIDYWLNVGTEAKT
ncbi:MAG TPA: DUF1616 domain-containing protein [Candidatus Saccharimonadales bacterium]